jgi:hypothetical protein
MLSRGFFGILILSELPHTLLTTYGVKEVRQILFGMVELKVENFERWKSTFDEAAKNGKRIG